jgi:Protein of unknown function (DUF3383)
MAISVKKFVDISSVAVEQSTIDPTAGMHLRVFTQATFNNASSPATQILDILSYPPEDRAPIIIQSINSLATFNSLGEVGGAFGTTSEEYKIAQIYFNCKNKNTGDRPPIIQFQKWNKNVLPSTLTGVSPSDVTVLNQINDGSLVINDFSTSTNYNIDNIDLTPATTQENIATIIEAAIKTNSALANIEFVYENNVFVLKDPGSLTVQRFFVLTGGGGTDLLTPIGFNSATFATGLPGMSINAAFNNSTELNSNFFSVIVTSDAGLDVNDVKQLAIDIDASDAGQSSHGNKYMYSIDIEQSQITDYVTNVLSANIQSLVVTLKKNGEMQHAAPCGIVANIDYLKRSSFVQAAWANITGLTASVSDTTYSYQLDNVKINYYGSVRALGQEKVGFFMGDCFTTSSDHFKKFYIYAGAEYVRRASCKKGIDVISTRNLPANNSGKASFDVALEELFERFLNSGVIIKEKSFSEEDKVTISNLTNNPDAWLSLYDSGYYYSSRFKDGSPTTLIYEAVFSAGDKIQKVEGTHSFVTAQ